MFNVEFFHSVMCGHCFIMSDRIRKIVKAYPEINIIHRSYPLRWDDQEENETFESEEEYRADMARKWEIANRIDDEHRFNLEGLKEMAFNMPTARRSMIAIQAGAFAGGDEWDLFDRFQEALYVENLNISDEEVIADIIIEAGVDFGEFLKYYENPKTEWLIKEDFKRADEYGLELIPAMVIEGKYIHVGTKRIDLALKLLRAAAEAEGIPIE